MSISIKIEIKSKKWMADNMLTLLICAQASWCIDGHWLVVGTISLMFIVCQEKLDCFGFNDESWVSSVKLLSIRETKTMKPLLVQISYSRTHAFLIFYFYYYYRYICALRKYHVSNILIFFTKRFFVSFPSSLRISTTIRTIYENLTRLFFLPIIFNPLNPTIDCIYQRMRMRMGQY